VPFVHFSYGVENQENIAFRPEFLKYRVRFRAVVLVSVVERYQHAFFRKWAFVLVKTSEFRKREGFIAVVQQILHLSAEFFRAYPQILKSGPCRRHSYLMVTQHAKTAFIFAPPRPAEAGDNKNGNQKRYYKNHYFFSFFNPSFFIVSAYTFSTVISSMHRKCPRGHFLEP